MAKSKTFTIEPLKETTLKLELIGDTDLILHKRSRYYEQAECWKQAHDKGTKMPEIYNQSKISGRDLSQAFTGRNRLLSTMKIFLSIHRKNGSHT